MIRLVFGIAFTAVILTFGPDWTVRLIIKAQTGSPHKAS